MNQSVSYEPPADVQKTGMEDAASRPRFRTFSAGALNFHRTPPCLPSGTTMHESVSYEPPADVQKTERQVFWQLKEGLDEFLPDKAVLPGGTSFAFLFLGFNLFDQFGV